MKEIKKIRLFNTPGIWFKDKINAGINRPGIYAFALIPSVIVIINLVANLTTLFEEVGEDLIFKTTIWLMFAYGIINFFLIWALQKMDLRLDRERDAFQNLNEKVVNVIKEYRAEKRQKLSATEQISKKFVVNYIKKVLEGTIDTYLKVLHRGSVSVAVKYLHNEQLFPIRAGRDCDRRNHEPEHIDQSFIYQCLTGFGKSPEFIFVQNVQDPDKNELKVIGPYEQEIKSRAQGNYETFMAFPLRGGRGYKDVQEGISVSADFGLLGIDLDRKYGFGNITKTEIYFLTNLADILTEPLLDLIEIQAQAKAEIPAN